MIRVDLTIPQAEALFDAGEAMLAGAEGEGDADAVDFSVLDRATTKLAGKLVSKSLSTAAKKERGDG
jgi:hypothetical protein